MSIPNTSEKSVDLDRQENITKGNLSAKKVALYTYDSSSDTLIPGLGDTSKPAATDTFNQQIIGLRNNQLEIDYSNNDPDSISILTVTKTNGGDASTLNGQAVYETSTNTSGEIKAITTRTVTYHPHAENYAAFTAIFTTGIANSYQRIGLYDDNNGFFIGYEGSTFGVTKRSGAVDSFTAQSSFSEDRLTGQSTSNYTRNGTPEAVDFTKDNLFRIRYGWLGAAPIRYEILSPDGDWVTFHIIKHPNTAAVPTIQEPNQPLRVHIKKTTAGATNLTVKTACWAAGTTTDLQKITSTLYDETLAKTVRSVITGVTTGGGGGYVNVKVTPSGSLTTAIGDITGIVGQNTMANSIPVTIASNQTALPVTDNGGSLTVDGIVAATKSGTWTLDANSGVDIGDVTINNASGASAVNIQDGGNSITVDGTVTANLGTGTGDVNLKQINGVTTATGSGIMGTGVQRVSIASDNDPVTVKQSTAANLNMTEANSSSIATNTSNTATNTSNTATNTTNIPNVVGTAASAIPSKLLQVGGSDGTNARAIKVNTSGQLDVRPLTSSDQITTVPSGTQTVSGTVTANAGTGNFTVTQGTATNLKAQAENYQGGTAVGAANPLQVSLANTGANATAVKVDASATTQPVSGTVTANQGGTWTVQPGNTANTTAWLVTNQNFSTSSVTSVAGSATSVQLLASTSGRKAAYFYNDSTADCYIKLGTTASTSSFTVKMVSNSFYELPQPCYTGKIDAIWSSATGNIRITEIT